MNSAQHQANMMGEGMFPDSLNEAAKPYTGIVTEVLTNGGQEIAFKYAHRPPTREDLQRMAQMLRREADEMERRLA
jgi:hypothetical protein